MFQTFPAPGPVRRAPQCSVGHWLRCMAWWSVCSGFTWGTTMGGARHGEASVRSGRRGQGGVWGEPALPSGAGGLACVCHSPCIAAWTGGL